MDHFWNNDRKNKVKVCANCRSGYIEGDRFCRFCGAKMGKAEFIEEDIGCIYGPPPMRRVHVCEKCGYTWETNQMIDNSRFCPECGGRAPAPEPFGAYGPAPEITTE